VVTNAVLHGGADHDRTIELRLRDEPDVLRVEVSDPGSGFDRSTPRRRADGGWGLLFVDKLADRWDVDRFDDHTVVWFELDISRNGPRASMHRRRRPPPIALSA
jgi:anti-sigma regulatory factor (Ser/Thr protein kinase)